MEGISIKINNIYTHSICFREFHESSCNHLFFNGYSKYFWRTLASIVYKMFDKYFYFRLMQFQRSACSHMFQVVTSLLQETTCSDLLFSTVLCFFQGIICSHLCSHLFFQRYWANFNRLFLENSSCSHTFFQITLVFCFSFFFSERQI